MPELTRVAVDLGDRSYDVVIGDGLLAQLARMIGESGRTLPRAVFAVVDSNAGPHAAAAIASLTEAGVAVARAEIEATEPEKSIATIERLLVAMAEARIERTDLVLAVGGGITGDVAGFAAASYRRGVPIVQCPTTLLSMVDASVGGKTGVNLPAGGQLQKNMVGAFHQPELVVADIASLATLPDRQFRAGLGECVKHGLIDGCVSDGTHLGWIASRADAITSREGAVLCELIERSVRFKAAIVAGDEREDLTRASGRSRALLNLGHTFAHAMETIGGLSPTSAHADAPLLHGEAVSLGLVAAAAMGARLGTCDAGLADEIAGHLSRVGLPTRIAGLPANGELIDRMGADKKATSGGLRVIAPEPGCRARLIDGPSTEALSAGWDRIRA